VYLVIEIIGPDSIKENNVRKKYHTPIKKSAFKIIIVFDGNVIYIINNFLYPTKLVRIE